METYSHLLTAESTNFASSAWVLLPSFTETGPSPAGLRAVRSLLYFYAGPTAINARVSRCGAAQTAALFSWSSGPAKLVRIWAYFSGWGLDCALVLFKTLHL